MIKIIYSILAIVIVSLFTVKGVEAQSFSRFYAGRDDIIAELSAKKQAVRFSLDLPFSLRMCPETEFAELIQEEYLSVGPNILVETVFFLPLQEKLYPDTLTLGIYNTLRSIRSLKGIEYYSVSRKKVRTFFNDAYMVKNAGDITPLPDPLVKKVPSSDNIVIFQEDTTFGKSYTAMRYLSGKGNILVTMRNLTELTYGPIRVIEKDSMIIDMLVCPMDGGILFYGLCSVKTADLFGIAKSRSESFYNRIAALYAWFSGNLPSHL